MFAEDSAARVVNILRGKTVGDFFSFFSNNFHLFSGGLGNLEQLTLLNQNLQESVATANFSFLPKLKVLWLQSSNLTKFTFPRDSAIANLDNLNLRSNPLLDVDELPYENFKNLKILELGKNQGIDIHCISIPCRNNVMNVSKIAKLPNTLVKLSVNLNEKPSAAYLQHLTKLKTLTIYTKADFDYNSLSGLPSLGHLQVEYVTPASHALNITLEGCPVSLEVWVTIDGGDVRSFQNRCPKILEIFLVTYKPCDCGVFNQLKTGVGEYRNSLHLFADYLVEIYTTRFFYKHQ